MTAHHLWLQRWCNLWGYRTGVWFSWLWDTSWLTYVTNIYIFLCCTCQFQQILISPGPDRHFCPHLCKYSVTLQVLLWRLCRTSRLSAAAEPTSSHIVLFFILTAQPFYSGDQWTVLGKPSATFLCLRAIWEYVHTTCHYCGFTGYTSFNIYSKYRCNLRFCGVI